MLGLPVWMVSLLGCPWISPAAHRDNQARLDQDADTDTDTDTETGTTHTGVPCTEEAGEPNDTLAQATPVDLPATVAAASCGGSPDHFSMSVGQRAVFAASVACEGDAIVRVYADGVLWETQTSACGETVRLGIGAGDYVVGVTSATGADLPYTLELTEEECFADDDLDGQPSAIDCLGGADCDDALGSGAGTRRGGTDIPGNGLDEDCDGADDLERQGACRADVNGFVVPDVPDLACGAPDVDPVWHHLTFDTQPGDSVEIFLTPPDGPADLFALYTDAGGRYGLDPGEDELDAEDTCSNPAYGDCPSTCLIAAGGTAELWVAQRDCTGPAAYQFLLAVNGESARVTIEADVRGP